MHFEIALLGDEVMGIAMFAIDLGRGYGLLECPEYGTAMGISNPITEEKATADNFFTIFKPS